MTERTSIFGIADEVREAINAKGKLLTDDGGLYYGLPPAPDGRVLVSAPAAPGGIEWRNIGAVVGAGDVDGPASSTDNAIARFDGTTGKLIQNSTVTVDDSGGVNANVVQIFGTVGGFGLSVGNQVGNTEFITMTNLGQSYHDFEPKYQVKGMKLRLYWGDLGYKGFTVSSTEVQYISSIPTDSHVFVLGSTEYARINASGTTTTKLTVPTAAGETIKIGTTGAMTSTADPAYISLGNTYYDGISGYNGYKLKLIDTGSNCCGIGMFANSMIYKVIDPDHWHTFMCGGNTVLQTSRFGTIAQGTLFAPGITTNSGDLSVSAQGSNINFNGKNITSAGAITSTGLTTPAITTASGDLSIAASGSNINFNSKTFTNVNLINIPIASGQAIKIDATTTPDAPSTNPPYITLGNKYYDAGNGGRQPYDLAGLKLRIYEAGTGGFGIGITALSLNYVSPNASGFHNFYVGTVNGLSIASTGITSPKLTIPTTTGEVIKIGSTTNATNGTGSPLTINLGDTYYTGANPYDVACLKLRVYQNPTVWCGIGASVGQINYVSSDAGTSHVFYVAGNERFRVRSGGVQFNNVRATSTTGGTIDFNGATLSNCVFSGSGVLTETQATATAGGTGWTGSLTFKFTKVGSIVSLRITGQITANASTSQFETASGVIPVGFRPLAAFITWNAGSTHYVCVGVFSSGIIKITTLDTNFTASEVLDCDVANLGTTYSLY